MVWRVVTWNGPRSHRELAQASGGEHRNEAERERVGRLRNLARLGVALRGVWSLVG